MELEQLSEDRHEEAAGFLTTIFPGSERAPFLDRALRHWMYYAPHPLCAESRCYVYRDDGALLAHGGFSPVEYEVPGAGVKSSFQILDWAGSPRRVGAGLLLFRELWSKADSYLAIGGTDDAKKINRAIRSMRPAGKMAWFALPLRPWGQLLSTAWSWKSPLKWARSWKWRLARPRFDLRAWQAIPVARLTGDDARLLTPASDGRYVPLRRTPELVNYWLDCPAARVRAWRLQYRGAPAGLLVLAFVPKEARIVDLIVNAPDLPLAEAYSLAIRLAAQNTDACELRAASSAPQAIEAMAAAGLIPRGADEVTLGDPQKAFAGDLPIEANLSIGDGFYRHGKKPYFYTFG
jgi:hypothetical protein